MQHLIVEESANQLVHLVVQRGGEEHPLPALRSLGQQAGDHRQESQISHMVGLIQNGDLNIVKGQHALLEQVIQPTGAGDDDVDPAAQSTDLTILTDTTEDCGGAQLIGGSQRLQGRVDLGGQFPGGGKDQGARA